MRPLPFKPVTVAAALFALAALPAQAQQQDQDHKAHHPDAAADAQEAPAPDKAGTPGMMMKGGMMMDMQGMKGMQGDRQCGMMKKGFGPDMLYGVPAGEELTPEKVRALLEKQLDHHGNARLKIGKIEAKGDATILAEIVTLDGALVQKLAFNRYPGLVRQVP